MFLQMNASATKVRLHSTSLEVVGAVGAVGQQWTKTTTMTNFLIRVLAVLVVPLRLIGL